MSKTKYQLVPRYYGLRIYAISTLLFMFLVFPITGILIFKYAPDLQKYKTGDYTFEETTDSDGISFDTIAISWEAKSPETDIIQRDSSEKDSLSATPSDMVEDENPDPVNPELENAEGRMTSHFTAVSNLWFRLLIISFVLGFAFNLPFKIYLRRKRRSKPIKESLFKFCKKYILRTPLINAGILFITYGIISGFMLYQLLFNDDFNEITIRFYKQFFFIMVVSSVLNMMFVYFWQKHRVHLKYLEFFFSHDELRKRIFNLKVGRIRNRLWISSAMTTFLPLLIVLFYMVISITNVNDLLGEEPSEEHIKILIGKYEGYFEEQPILWDWGKGILYVNLLDTYIMLIGTFSGIMVSFFYLLLFIRWTTADIVYPVKELLVNMQRTGRGEMESYSIVRTNDEIGELTEGYNEMSGKLKEYIENISMMNEANSRFVPRQFLEYLGKESIADIQLGDQVQKEMTVLFTDIRDFTSISEHMTPKENFNFLNNYLGYMEPVIRNNHGFVDKFIGDSIMALFPDNTEDAINAAIEMRIKLVEFNHIISQFGQPPIDSGIGIHSGSLMLGIVGGEGRMEGTVISDAVNLASRLEGLTKVYGSSIIITEETLVKIGDPTNYNYRFLDIVKVKGKKEAVYIFEVIDGDPEDIREMKDKSKDLFVEALQLYKNKEFKSALQNFKKVLKINPFDQAAMQFIGRCQKFIDLGFPDDWDGIESFTSNNK